MKKHEWQSILQNGPEPKRIKETQQICTTILNQQKQLNLIPEERTKFWQFLSDVMHYIGWRLWLSQGIVSLFICAGVFSIPDTPNVISMFIPLLILACLPSFYQSSNKSLWSSDYFSKTYISRSCSNCLFNGNMLACYCRCRISSNTNSAHYVCHCSIFRMFNIDTLEYEKKRTVRNTV